MTHVPQRAAGDEASRPVLKLHDGQRDRQRGHQSLSADMTLPEFYRAFYRPVILVAQGAEDRTLREYDQSIAYWERFTQQPSLGEINDFDISAFMMALSALPGRKGEPISPNTIRKHCTQLQAVITKAGPRTPHIRSLRKAQSLIPEVPWFEKPREREKLAEDDFTVEEIGRLLAHCAAAVAPSYLASEHRAAWWRHLIRFAYNTGLRIGSVLAVEWQRIATDAQQRSWVYVPVKRGNTQKVYLNGVALACLDAMRPLTGQFTRAWHWPHDPNWLQENRRRILAAAGFPPERCFGFHGFRKAMNTEVSETDPLAAQMQSGHSNFEMTQRKYINPKRVAKAMEQLPQPKVPTRQRSLFE